MVLNMEEVREKVEKYTPEVLKPEAVVGMIYGICNTARKFDELNKTYKTADKVFREYKRKAIRRTHSNNWLKLHGYPMRRGKENRDLKD